ncbi:sugar phosphate isomerase/epimerase family protein [Kribbella sp. NPDC004875]|uniref:sugar phosphate isomerase/epimerase family protein n=1 Tax=Kribbella sp. NPDC004875 TaxID=3364107 RepID=UPI003692B4A0
MSSAADALHLPPIAGIAARDLPAHEDVVAALDELQRRGAGVLLLPSPRDASPDLDPGELREVRAEASRRGVTIETGIGELHPDRFRYDEKLALLAAGEVLGVTAYHTSFGVLADRFRTDPTWEQQRAAGVAGVRSLVERAERPLVLRTHEEMTTFELCRLVDQVDHPGLRVGFSPVNVITRLEDPLSALERIADLVRTVFVDDAWVVRTGTGLARRLRRLGDGDLPWRAIVDRLADRPVQYILDIHRAEFDMPLYDATWLGHHSDLTVQELVAVLRASRDAGEQTPASERAAWALELLRGHHREGEHV